MELLKGNPSMNDLIQKLNEVVENINGSLPSTENELSEVKKLISFGSDTLVGRLNTKLWYFKTQELMTASTELCEGDSCFVLKDGATTGNGTFEYWYIHKTNDVKDIMDSYVDLANSDLVAVKLQDMSLKDVKDTLSAQITKQVGDLSVKVDTLASDTKNSLGKKADLVDGLVPSSQLPSYVDDVIESWLKDEEFPKNAYAKEDTEMTAPITPEESKIYVNLLNNKTYRWGGNFYVEVSKSLAIGETSTTAFAGDKGKNLEEKIETHEYTLNSLGYTPDFCLTPYACYHEDTSVLSYQSACEFDYEKEHYMAIGVTYSSTESGIKLFKNGKLLKEIKGSYGHINSLTYCDKDNRLYIGASSSISPSRPCYSINATTLEDLVELNISSHTIWYDTFSSKFYVILNSVLYCWDLVGGVTNRTKLFSISSQGYTAQTICIYHNRVLYSVWDSTNSSTHLLIYDFNGKYLGKQSFKTIYEGEQIYVYKEELYMNLNSLYNSVSSTTKEYVFCASFECFKLIYRESSKIVNNAAQDTIYFNENAGLYGDGTQDNPTSSALMTLLSEKSRIYITGKFVLPTYPLHGRKIQFLGDNPQTDWISLMNYRVSCISFMNLRVSAYHRDNNVHPSHMQHSTVFFESCIIDGEFFQKSSNYVNVRDCILRFISCTYYNHTGKLLRIFNDDYGSKAFLFDFKCDVTDVSEFNYQNEIFSYKILVDIVYPTNTLNTLNSKCIVREFNSVKCLYAIEKSGTTFDLNTLSLPNICQSFSSQTSLLNKPESISYSSRILLITKQFGSTNGILQFLITETEIFMRTLTGINYFTFDASGNVTTPNLVAGTWVKLSTTA